MTTLVTGATGFIGSAITRALVESGHKVKVFSRPTSKRDRLAGLEVDYAYGDILAPDTVTAAMKGMETVYHAAAMYEFGVKDTAALISTAVDGTRNVLEAALQAGVSKVVYTSSVYAIGEKPGQVATENTKHSGTYVTPYHEAKAKAEDVAREYAAKGLHVAIINPAAVYGPGDDKAMGELILNVLNEKVPAILEATISVVYIDDVVRGHLLGAEKGKSGQRYILSERLITVNGLIDRLTDLADFKRPGLLPNLAALPAAFVMEKLSELIRKPPVVTVDATKSLLAGARADGLKAVAELGLAYTPLEVALPETLEWYWNSGLLQKKPRFLEEPAAEEAPAQAAAEATPEAANTASA